MRNIRRVASLLLAAVMLAGTLPAGALAAEPATATEPWHAYQGGTRAVDEPVSRRTARAAAPRGNDDPSTGGSLSGTGTTPSGTWTGAWGECTDGQLVRVTLVEMRPAAGGFEASTRNVTSFESGPDGTGGYADLKPIELVRRSADYNSNIIKNYGDGSVVRTSTLDVVPQNATDNLNLGSYYSFGTNALDYAVSNATETVDGKNVHSQVGNIKDTYGYIHIKDRIKGSGSQVSAAATSKSLDGVRDLVGPNVLRSGGKYYNSSRTGGGYDQNILSWFSEGWSSAYEDYGKQGTTFPETATGQPYGGINGVKWNDYETPQAKLITALMRGLGSEYSGIDGKAAVTRFLSPSDAAEYAIIVEPVVVVYGSGNSFMGSGTKLALTYHEMLALAQYERDDGPLSGKADNNDAKYGGTLATSLLSTSTALGSCISSQDGGFHSCAVNMTGGSGSAKTYHIAKLVDGNASSMAVRGSNESGVLNLNHGLGTELGNMAAKGWSSTYWGVAMYEPYMAQADMPKSLDKTVVAKKSTEGSTIWSGEYGNGDLRWPFAVAVATASGETLLRKWCFLTDGQEVQVKYHTDTADSPVTVTVEVVDNETGASRLIARETGKWGTDYRTWIREASPNDTKRYAGDKAAFTKEAVGLSGSREAKWTDADTSRLEAFAHGTSLRFMTTDGTNVVPDVDSSGSMVYHKQYSVRTDFTRTDDQRSYVTFNNVLSGFSFEKEVDREDSNPDVSAELPSGIPYALVVGFNGVVKDGVHDPSVPVDFSSSYKGLWFVVMDDSGNIAPDGVGQVGSTDSAYTLRQTIANGTKETGRSARACGYDPVYYCTGKGLANHFVFLPKEGEKVYLLGNSETNVANFANVYGFGVTERFVRAEDGSTDFYAGVCGESQAETVAGTMLNSSKDLSAPAEYYAHVSLDYMDPNVTGFEEAGLTYEQAMSQQHSYVRKLDDNSMVRMLRSDIKSQAEAGKTFGPDGNEAVDADYGMMTYNAFTEYGSYENGQPGLLERYHNFKAVNMWRDVEVQKSGTCHVLIDYNLNGIPATESSSVSGQDVVMSAVGADPVDCGDLEVGKEYVFGLEMAGGALYNGRVVDFGQVKNEADNKYYAVKATFKGLSRSANGNGGISVGNDGKFTYKVSDKADTLDVLYCNWEFSVNVKPDPVPVPDPGGGIVENCYLTTIYWDKGYDSGGITSNVVGTFSIPYGVKAGMVTIESDEDGTTVTHTNIDGNYFTDEGEGYGTPTDDLDGWNIKRRINVHFMPSVPHVYRDHYDFVGWSRNPSEEQYTWKSADVEAAKKRLAGNLKSTVVGLVDEAIEDGVNNGVSGGTANTTTLYAIWWAKPVTWDANGGTFNLTHMAPWATDESTSEDGGIFWYHTVNDPSGELGTYEACTWQGWINAVDLVPIVKRIPERDGYEFTGWYCDPNCTIPVIRSDGEGMTPGQHFWAGWEPEKVVVNYYDTRQGTGFLGSQTFDYDDEFIQLGKLMQTDGWTSDGWRLNYTDGKTTAQNAVLLNKDLAFGGVSALTRFDSGRSHWFNFQSGKFSDRPVKDGTEVGTNSYWVMNLYASHDKMRASSYTAYINWQDYSNNDGARPVEVTIGLVNATNGTTYATHTLHKDDAGCTGDVWQYTFEDLPTTTSDASTEKINWEFRILSYRDIESQNADEPIAIEDTGATSGDIVCRTVSNADTSVEADYHYSLDFTGSNLAFTPGEAIGNNVNWAYDRVGMAYFNHNLITTGDDVKFTIQWDDDSDRDGYRPGAVTLTLYANGTPVQSWAGTGSHESNTGVVSVSPAMCEVSEDGNTWTYVFRDYQKYKNGGAIRYTVGMTDYNRLVDGKSGVDGYKTYYDGSSSEGTVGANRVVASRTVDKVRPVTTIKWDDQSNRDDTRPEEVTVRLLAYQWNGDTYRWETVEVDTATVTSVRETDSQTIHWGLDGEGNPTLPRYSGGGKEIVYKAEVVSDLDSAVKRLETEKSVVRNGYTWTAATSGKTGSTVVIHHDADRVDVTATVEWDDGRDMDALRPEAVRFRLFHVVRGADGSPVVEYLTADGDVPVVTGGRTDDAWTHVFASVPLNEASRHGERIVYGLDVVEIAEGDLYGDYIDTPNGEQQRITRYVAGYIDRDGHLSEDMASSVQPYVRLSHGRNTGTIYIYASWHDETNRDGKRPTNFLIDLYKQVDGERTYLKTINLAGGRDNAWTSVEKGVPLFEDGKEILYVADVSEDARAQLAKSGYTVTAQGLNIHLYYTPETGSVSTAVNWKDNDNNDGVRPDGLSVRLYSNGKDTGRTSELNESNGWSATWDDLPTYYRDNKGVGQAVVYTVRVEAPDGYSVEYAPASTTIVEPEVVYINLSHETGLVSRTVTVDWNDADNNDGVRPESVMVQLYADGQPVAGRREAVTAADGWAHEFAGLPAKSGGRDIDYTVRLSGSVPGYEHMDAGMTVYMSHGIATGSLYVSFRFDDNGNADGLRPEGGYLVLKRGGKRVDNAGYVHTVYWEADGTVNDVFEGLPVYGADGERLTYSVEVEWDDGIFGGEGAAYKDGVSRDIQLAEGGQKVNQLVIAVKLRDRKTATQSGSIYWFDNNNQRGNRPPDLTINVYDDAHTYRIGEYVLEVDGESGLVYNAKDKSEPVGKVDVKSWGTGQGANGTAVWEYTIRDLPANAIYDGESHEVTYYATAQATGLVPWYSILDGQANGMNVNLTHVNYVDDRPSAVQDYQVTVNWLDGSNAWGYRPDELGVDLVLEYMTGNGWSGAYRTAHLTRKNAVTDNPDAWTYTFRDLPTYLEGQAVQWHVTAVDARSGLDTWYDARFYERSATGGTIDMVQVVNFDLSARWEDFGDNDRVRPEELSVVVYGDGKPVGAATLSGEGDVYVGRVEDLPVYRTVGSGAVQYTFAWDDGTASGLEDLRYSARATRDGSDIESGTWYWLSASVWGDKSDPGMDGEANYKFETTLSRDKELVREVFGSVRFDDAADQDGRRPARLSVQLYGETESAGRFEVGESVELAPEGGRDLAEWPVSWHDLDAKLDGEYITYTIDVVDGYDGYGKSVSEDGRTVTLSYVPETTVVTAVVRFDDSSEAHYHYQFGIHTSTTYEIRRWPVYISLEQDGKYANAFGTSGMLHTAEGEDMVTYSWTVPVYHDHGTKFEYDTSVRYVFGVGGLGQDASPGNLGFGTRHEKTGEYETLDTVWRDLFSVSGTVYRNYVGDAFRLGGAPVTAYVRDAATGTYEAVGSTTTNEDGTYEIPLCVRTGDEVVVRATFLYGDYAYAGSSPIEGRVVDRHDASADVLVDRDAAVDADLYRYSASGRAMYQTDKADPGSVRPVDGGIVLLYRAVDGKNEVEYVGMTTTGPDGGYAFGGLPSGSYVVNVVFEYDGGVYTYDNADALAEGLSFVVAGADRAWPTVTKQVNAKVDPKPNEPEPIVPDEPDEPEHRFVTGGHVYFSEGDAHTTDPVEGVDVYIYDSNNVQAGKAVTGADGTWSVEGLAEGSYVAVFSHQGGASRVLRFEVAAGDVESGSLELADQYFGREAVEPTAVIRGVVLDEDGNRVPAMVQVLDGNGDIIGLSYADKSGFYAFTVPAGGTYTVRVQEVGVETRAYAAGDPDDDLTVLDYYVASGTCVVDGEPQANKTVAIYKQDEALEWKLLTWTLTDAEGAWSVKLYESGNYDAVLQSSDGRSASHKFSVGYQEYEPRVVAEDGGTWSIVGGESYDGLLLQNTTTGVVLREETDRDGEGYALTGLSAGTYDLTLIQGLVEKHYYIDCPDDAVDVTWYMTVSGKVAESGGRPVIGTVVGLYDADGSQVGEDIIVTDGSYGWTNVAEGSYEVRVTYPVAGTQLGVKSTGEPDSYDRSYPGGMPEGSEWAWNMNAMALSGTVADQRGEPVVGATVVARSVADPSLAFAGRTDADGAYRIAVVNGAYSVDAMMEVDADHIYHADSMASATVDGADVGGVDLRIPRYVLSGTARRSGDGKPIEGVSVSLSYVTGGKVAEAVTGKDGAFAFTVWADRYVLSGAYGDDTATVQATVSGDAAADLVLGDVIYLSGTVLDVDGAPVADGIVRYSGPKSGVAYTGEDGRFSVGLSADELGRYTLYAEAAGNRSDSVTVDVATDTDVELRLKASKPDVELRTLSGVVTDEEGHRLANTEVTVRYGDDKAQSMTTSTNAEGEYRFLVEDGTYYVTAVYRNANGETYSTNAEAVFHVSGGDLSDADVVIRVGHEVFIRVVDTDGNAVEGAEVTWTGASTGIDETDADGLVSKRLPGGSYTFQAFVGNRASEPVRKDVAAGTEVVLVVDLVGLAVVPPELGPTDLTVSGTVYDSHGETYTLGADVTFYVLVGEDGDEDWEFVDSTTSDGDGYYEFTGLAGGRYRVDMSFDESYEASSETEYFDIDDYAADVGGNPYVDATVNLYDKSGTLVASTVTDKSGHFRFEYLDYGTYKVEVIPVNIDDEGNRVEDPDAAEDWTVSSPKGSAFVISGTAVDAAGRKVEGAVVVVVGSDGETEASMTTGDDGRYEFEVPAGEYRVTITYPLSYEVLTDGYEPDADDPNSPDVVGDGYVVSGTVLDTDDNPVEGATVSLSGKGVERSVETGPDGRYAFDGLRPGEYDVTVSWKGETVTYHISADGTVESPEEPERPDRPERKVRLSGVVVTDHKRPLPGAVVTVVEEDSGTSFELVADADGRFDTGEMERGRYTVRAEYTHDKGSNRSDSVTSVASRDDVALAIVLRYDADVDGDGRDETVFAGTDDEFDTPDDFYLRDVGGDGVDDAVMAGPDGRPGTADDWYAWNLGNGDDKVTVGPDRRVGTMDDRYPVKGNTVYIGKDGVPATSDDWYSRDVDGDRSPEQVFLGDDAKHDTKDDWYLDGDGNKEYVTVWVRFNPNGGKAGDKVADKDAEYGVKLSGLERLPVASRDGHTFLGWFVPGGAKAATLDDVKALTVTTVLTASWRANGTGGSGSGGSGSSGGGGGGGGGSFGGGGGGGGTPSTAITDPTTPLGDLATVIFDSNGGTDVAPVSVAKGQLLAEPRRPVHKDGGYAFLGWYLSDGGKKVKFDFTKTPVEGDMTLVAEWEYKGVASLLNLADHVAYVRGFSDGTVRPTADISRAEVAMIFYRLLADDVRDAFRTDKGGFSDVSADDWFGTAVNTLAAMGVVNGRGNGVFDPTAKITRAEFAAIAARMDRLDGKGTEFDDVPKDYWAHAYIVSAAAKGWVNGSGNGLFEPGRNISRAEVMAIMNRMLGRDTVTADGMLEGMVRWSDNSDASVWYYLDVQEATNAHKFDERASHEVWTKLEEAAVGDR